MRFKQQSIMDFKEQRGVEPEVLNESNLEEYLESLENSQEKIEITTKIMNMEIESKDWRTSMFLELTNEAILLTQQKLRRSNQELFDCSESFLNTPQQSSLERQSNSGYQQLTCQKSKMSQIKEQLRNSVKRVQSLKCQEERDKQEYQATSQLFQQETDIYNTVTASFAQATDQSKTNVDKKLKLQNSLKQVRRAKQSMKDQIHNSIGNIRVFLRVKPKDLDSKQKSFFGINRSLIKFVLPKNEKSDNYKRQFSFAFEDIFSDSSQVNIFSQFQSVIETVMVGKNVCIFAYGQTGSGKTYTMQGSPDNPGIIPRSLEMIFDQIQIAKEHKWQHRTFVDCVQIYNDDVRYLCPKQYQVKSAEEIGELLNTCHAARAVAETSCNERSSRSHLIFTVKLFASRGKIQRFSYLSLIDLAGSERVDQSKVTGDRLKETISINKSLTHLGLVIESMAKKSGHIPYRNSKLTAFLEPILSGDTKTMMMVCISPMLENWNQTLPSLSFAEKVKKVTTKSENEMVNYEEDFDFE